MFLIQLEQAGISVRVRYSQIDPTVVTGYAVADDHDRTSAGELIWFGGAQLTPQLSLPRMVGLWQRQSTETGRGQSNGAEPHSVTARQLLKAAKVTRQLEGLVQAGLTPPASADLSVHHDRQHRSR